MAADAWDRASPEARAAAISKSTGVWNDWCEDKESDDPIDGYARALLDAEERGREAGREEEREACAKIADREYAEHRGGSALSDELHVMMRSHAKAGQQIAAAIRQRAQQPPQPARSEALERMMQTIHGRAVGEEPAPEAAPEGSRPAEPLTPAHGWGDSVVADFATPVPLTPAEQLERVVKLLADALEALLRVSPILLVPEEPVDAARAALRAAGREPR